MNYIKQILLVSVTSVWLFGCSTHDTSSVKTALLGHWVTESDGTHYYMDESSSTMVEKGGRQLESTYTVLESNEAKGSMKVRVVTHYGKGHDAELVFGEDRKSLVRTAYWKEMEKLAVDLNTPALAKPTVANWSYVDAKRKP